MHIKGSEKLIQKAYLVIFTMDNIKFSKVTSKYLIKAANAAVACVRSISAEEKKGNNK